MGIQSTKARREARQRRESFLASAEECARMAQVTVGPVKVSRKKLQPSEGDELKAISDKEARWCSYGFLLAAEWFRRQDVAPPSKEYIEALAGMYGLPVPKMEAFDHAPTLD